MRLRDAREIRRQLPNLISLISIMMVGLAITGYIVLNQDARPRIPLLEEDPFVLKAAFSDAQAVVPGQGQRVRVAGAKVGLVSGVDLVDGQAVVSMDIDRDLVEHGDLTIRSDATALLRPRTGLKDMFVELDPGTSGRVLEDGDTLPVSHTAPDVDPDEVLAGLDTDTRAYLQLLVSGLGKGLDGHGVDLREVFRRLGPTYRDVARVSGAVAARKRAFRHLVHNYGSLMDELAHRDEDLTRLVGASDAVLRAFASEDRNISAALARLPGTLEQTARAVDKLDRYGRVLAPTLEALRPPVRELDTANRALRPFALKTEPIIRTQIRPFVRRARPYLEDVRPAARSLATAGPDLAASFHELNRFFNIGAHNPRGAEPVTGDAVRDRERDEGYLFWLGWAGHITDNLFSTSDASGPFRRALLAFSCDTLRQLTEEQPVSELILGTTNLLNSPGLCKPEGRP